LLKQWPAAGPALAWRVNDLGAGYGAPAVAAGRVYLVANKGLADEFVLALDARDGKPAGTAPLGKVSEPNQRPNYASARSTPTVDGDALYALGSDGDLARAGGGRRP
jgi:outer membrane protein assembly factor BamB